MTITTKPTRGIKRLLDRMGDGVLWRIYDANTGRWVYLLPSDQAARSDVVERAIKDGFIKPGNDALFESRMSQTWRKA